jgi:hypothetical protein
MLTVATVRKRKTHRTMDVEDPNESTLRSSILKLLTEREVLTSAEIGFMLSRTGLKFNVSAEWRETTLYAMRLEGYLIAEIRAYNRTFWRLSRNENQSNAGAIQETEPVSLNDAILGILAKIDHGLSNQEIGKQLASQTLACGNVTKAMRNKALHGLHANGQLTYEERPDGNKYWSILYEKT